ncbi:hypothetical protein A1O3_02995 [Capronia epimyces CBS 606.96]|uniref:Dipeptidase n=1 Tax=Capronia epimyces CBS 606.96 TaxID=1182542 RepID=W9YBR3_9EURO|nr:uncharacterized protein A1O3_02995 [Capronia epimyces CBS 606.96]EXJ89928.1 hypothetical protein A1O3_02995 [Capronia epimyces CBS 606.96]
MPTPVKQALAAKSRTSISPSDSGKASAPSGGWGWPVLTLVTVVVIAVTVLSYPFHPKLELSNTGLWEKILLATSKEESIDAKDYLGRAKRILQNSPLIDGHNDFPFLLRQQLHGEIYGHDFEAETLASHTDLWKMRDGMMGGQFWSVYVPCPEDLVPGVDLDDPNKRVPDLNEPNWAVRDTLEQIDLTKRLVARYPAFLEFCTNPSCVRRAHKQGRIASMIGIEGGHQLGNSLGALRLFFETGARYVTLTHNCDNAFGTSWISVNQTAGTDSGLTKFGHSFVREMNRLGMMVDLAHVSPNTMRHVLRVAKAPVIFSHSGSYSMQKHLRNVPDDVLKVLVPNGGIVMVPAISFFMNTNHPEDATVEDVVDHILWIAHVAGWEHVGLGSDFDGSTSVVHGLEDTSQWPKLIARLLARGNVTDQQAQLLVGENLLRVWDDIERVARLSQQGAQLPCEESWEDRVWEVENQDVPRLFPKEG